MNTHQGKLYNTHNIFIIIKHFFCIFVTKLSEKKRCVEQRSQCLKVILKLIEQIIINRKTNISLVEASQDITIHYEISKFTLVTTALALSLLHDILISILVVNTGISGFRKYALTTTVNKLNLEKGNCIKA